MRVGDIVLLKVNFESIKIISVKYLCQYLKNYSSIAVFFCFENIFVGVESTIQSSQESTIQVQPMP